jgi:hypothetical protein
MIKEIEKGKWIVKYNNVLKIRYSKKDAIQTLEDIKQGLIKPIATKPIKYKIVEDL